MKKPKLGFKCCLCGKHTLGWGGEKQYGNNPTPLKEKGECCGLCNATKVVPARLANNPK